MDGYIPATKSLPSKDITMDESKERLATTMEIWEVYMLSKPGLNEMDIVLQEQLFRIG